MNIERLIADVRDDPYIPEFTKNKAGMQGDGTLSSGKMALSRMCWVLAMEGAISRVNRLMELGVHKQHANRLLMPFQHINTILTGTEFYNFFKLRISPEAQPEMCELATKMADAMDESEPVERNLHMPLTDYMNKETSVARCARVSYGNHAVEREPEEDRLLHDKLLVSGHLSPFEHQATAQDARFYANLRGWSSYRYALEHGNEYP